MIHDYLEIENAEGMPEMADSAVALEFLMSIKNRDPECSGSHYGIKNACGEGRIPETACRGPFPS